MNASKLSGFRDLIEYSEVKGYKPTWFLRKACCDALNSFWSMTFLNQITTVRSIDEEPPRHLVKAASVKSDCSASLPLPLKELVDSSTTEIFLQEFEMNLLQVVLYCIESQILHQLDKTAVRVYSDAANPSDLLRLLLPDGTYTILLPIETYTEVILPNQAWWKELCLESAIRSLPEEAQLTGVLAQLPRVIDGRSTVTLCTDGVRYDTFRTLPPFYPISIFEGGTESQTSIDLKARLVQFSSLPPSVAVDLSFSTTFFVKEGQSLVQQLCLNSLETISHENGNSQAAS